MKRPLEAGYSLPVHESGSGCQSPSKDEFCTICSSVLTKIKHPTTTDLIRQCHDIDFENIVEEADQYFMLADKELHVFPFKDVRPCWHRLYTDTSIIKAAKLAQASPTDGGIDWLDPVVHTLDMAMIMAGGCGREDMLVGLYKQLAKVLYASRQCHQSKKLKLSDEISSEEHSVPKLMSPIREYLHKPTMTAFEDHIQQIKEPVVLTGVVSEWPASSKWISIEYWRRVTLGGRRLVPVEIGRSYVDEDWGQQIIPFSTFLDDYIIRDSDRKGYLAQFDLFRHLPSINGDIATPDYCFVDAPPPELDIQAARPIDPNEDVQKNIWFGPAWTITPLHQDPYHNILCQVVGKKYIRLYSPQHSGKLYPRAKNEPAPHGEGTIDMSNTSRVDVAAMELSPDEDWEDQWPDMKGVPFQEIILEAGQALYIPVGWWHYVRSCSVGISVSFWW